MTSQEKATQDMAPQDKAPQDMAPGAAAAQGLATQSMAPEEVPLPDAPTVAAYESTHYFAHEADRVLLRIGDPPDSHLAWLEKVGARTATILTAWNPLGQEKSQAENDRAQEHLLASIRERELRWLPASGEDPAGGWQPEPGFCVFDVPDPVLDHWLVRFRQNAAVQATREDPCRLVWHPALRAR